MAVLFTADEDRQKLKEILSITTKDFYTGMSEFQIKHFVINSREFPNDVHKLQQVKFELVHRGNTFYDLYYQYKKYNAENVLNKAKIEEQDEIINDKKSSLAIKNKAKARITLFEIEIEKNERLIASVQREAAKILVECRYFHDIYKELKHLELLSLEELKKQWDEGWHIKSAYYPELQERYGLMPSGFQKLPHEDGGIEALQKLQCKMEKKQIRS